MRVLPRAQPKSVRVPRKRRAAEYDRAVAEFFMRLALEEARKGLGRTSPNPVVGAILVKGGRVIARGYHRQAGTPHAEVVAIQAAGARSRGADLYTTLEPCAHHGRTPPCTEAILAAGIRRVVSGSSDPNPLVNGKGLARLRRAGVPVIPGVLVDEADRLNRPFFKFMRTGLPWVTLKAAATLDGKIATATGDSRWVTGPLARQRVHELRDQADVVLVGANTVLADNPRLTVRLGRQGTRDPVRVIVDSGLSLPLERQVFQQRSTARTIVATLQSTQSAKARRLARAGVEVWTTPALGRRVDLKHLLARIGKAGLVHVLAEGGAQVFGALLEQQLADELYLFLAPKLVGSAGLSWSGALAIEKMSEALAIRDLHVERVGEDLLLSGALGRG